MKTAIALGVVAGAAVVCFGRVYLQYHTPLQVLAGAALGSLCGAAWFAAVHRLLAPLVFPWIESWRLSKLLLIRDASAVDDLLLLEYEALMAARAAPRPKPLKEH